MLALKLLARLLAYYLAVGAVVSAVLWLVPAWQEYLPIGRVPSLLAKAGGGVLDKGQSSLQIGHVTSLGGSMVWLISAVVGALVTSLPVTWVYMDVRDPESYDQSLVDTILILPLVVTSIVVVVQNSLALSFSLAGIAGAARFRNSLKSSGDLLFILLAIGIGLSCGIGAMELAAVSSIAFNLAFVALWSTEYGERRGMKRFMSDFTPNEDGGEVVMTAVSATVVTETVKPRKEDRDDD